MDRFEFTAWEDAPMTEDEYGRTSVASPFKSETSNVPQADFDLNDMPRLAFSLELNDADFAEIRMKGWCGAALAEFPDGRRYEVTFFEPVRLQQELTSRAARGRPWLSEEGLIVLTDVTKEYMEAAIQDLWKDGWFDHLAPIRDV